MRADMIDNDDRANHRKAYRRERNLLAQATTPHLVDQLDADDDLTRTAARDELRRRGENVST